MLTYDFSDLKTDEQTGYKSYQDPETGAKAKLGIDVSEFQGEVIDWKQAERIRRRICYGSSRVLGLTERAALLYWMRCTSKT